MTIKELSDFTGKSEKTVRRWKERAGDKVSTHPLDKMSKGEPQDFTIDEVEAILKAGSMSKDAVSILMQNAREKHKQLTAPGGMNQEAVQGMATVIGAAIKEAMTPIVNRLDKMEQKQLPQIKEDRYTLIGYANKEGINLNRSELASHGMKLKKMCVESGKKISKVPDERWGSVNSYPVEILEEYFTP